MHVFADLTGVTTDDRYAGAVVKFLGNTKVGYFKGGRPHEELGCEYLSVYSDGI